jgi:phage-related minor tail protein
MELAELKFVVDTKQLEDAAKKIDALAVSVSKVNKPVTDAAMKSEKLAQAQAKTAREAAKLEEANTKASIAAEKLAKAQNSATESSKTHMSILEKQTSITSYMSDGLSKGMATIMSYGKAAGLAAGDLKLLLDTLQTQKKFSGDPFDNSLSGVTSLKNELSILREVQRLYGAGVDLTSKQVRELASDKERLIVKLKQEGSSLSAIKESLRNLNSEYIGLATSINKLSDAEKQRIKQQNDAARATEYVASETERLNRLTESNGSVTSATNNKLIKFEQALKATGMSANEQVIALEKYKASLLSVQKAAGNRQIDYLSRALGPQITDIGVGLATGQAPLTILLQQGGQLRDQFALAGVAGSEMGKMLVQASKAMVTSIKDIGLAVGQLVTGAIAGTGKAIFDGIIAPFKRLSEARDALKQFDDGLISSTRYARLMELATGRMYQSLFSLGKVIGVTAAIGLGLLAKGLYDVIKEQDAMTTQLVLTGASLGVNTTAAISYANSLNSVGVTTASALKVMQAMAKEGGFVAGEINMIVTSANNLKLAGVAIEDTVKQFAKLKEKPVEALLEIAKATGMVSPEVTKLVYELAEQGKTSEAAAVAMKAYADVTVKQKDRLKSELSDFAIFVKSLSSSIAEFFDEVFRGLFRKTSPTEAIKREIADLENTIKLGTQASPETKARNDANLSALKEQLKLSQQALDIEQTRSSDQARNAKMYQSFIADQAQFASNEMKRTKEIAEAENKYQGLVKNGQISQLQYETLISNIKDKYKDAKPEVDKEAEALRKSAEKYLNRISSLTNAATKEQENYTKAQKLALDIFSDPTFANQPELMKRTIVAAIERAHAEELVADELERQRKISEQVVKTRNELVSKGSKEIEQAKVTTKALEEESALYDYRLSLVGLQEKEVEKILSLKKIEIEYEKELARIKSLGLLSGQESDLRLQAYSNYLLKKEVLDKASNLKVVQDLQKEYDRISNGVTDSIVTALFEGGKAGSKKLRDLIIAELKKPITIVVKALIDATLGSFIQSAIGSAAGSSGASFAGSAAGSAATGGISNMAIGGATLGAQAGAFGSGVASGFSFGAPVSSMGSATSASFNAGATYGAPVLGAVGGMAINRGISNGYKISNTVNTVQDIATAVASAINPVFGLIAGAFSGLTNRAFGRKLAGVGIEGTLGGETGFEGNRYTFEKGGFFRSNKTTRSVLEEADRSAIASDFRLIKTSVMELAESAGFGSSALDNFTQRFAIDLMNLSPEDAVKKYKEEFAKIEESMAKAVIGTSGYRRENETNIQALSRISGFMKGVNTAFEKLGFETYKLELASLDAAQSFVDMFGGIEGFSQAMSFFYENFFTDAEKTANLTKDLTDAFADLGVELPGTREAFRALVTTAQEAGDDQQVKNLLDLQQAFAQLVPVTEVLVETVELISKTMQDLLKERANLEVELLQVQGRTDEANAALRRIATEGFTEAEIAAYDFNQSLRNQIQAYKDADTAAKEAVKSQKEAAEKLVQTRTQETDAALDSVRRAIDAEKELVQVRLDAAEKEERSIKAVFDLLSSTISDIRGQSNAAGNLNSARALISNAINTGVLPDADKLSDALNIVRGSIESTAYATKTEQIKAGLKLANELQSLQDIAEPQLSAAERAVILAQDQLVILDNQLKQAQLQVDALRGVDTSIVSLSTAMGNLATAISAEAAAKAAVTASNKTSTSTASQSSTGGYNLVTTATGATLNFPGGGSHSVAGPDAVKLLTEAYGLVSGPGGSLVRTRADGGYTPPGMTLVGEDGPELVNFSRPSMVYTAAQTSSLMGGSSSEELAAIRQELIMLRAETRAVVSNTSKTAKILDRSSPDGQSLQVTVVTP